VGPYKKTELQKLPSEEYSYHVVILKYEILSRYYILIAIVTKKKKSKKCIAFDLYAKTFQTGFSSDGSFMEYGKGDIKKLFVLGKKIAKLKSKMDKHKKIYI
jgi:transposase